MASRKSANEQAEALGEEADPPRLAGWAYPGLDYPTFHLVLIAKAIDRLTLRTLHDDDAALTVAEWRVLSRLAPTTGATVRQIAEWAWVDRAEVSRAASELERRGLTSRRPNPADKRSPILFCTPQGHAEYKRLLPIRAAFHAELSGLLDEEEAAALDRLLVRIANGIGARTGNG
jgi:DNA-binding MarR family transcriptional regulator